MMKNITLYISFYGIHGIVDEAITSSTNAQPLAPLYENIYLPRLSVSVKDTLDSTLAEWFEINNNQNDYHIGLFYNTINHDPFKQFFEQCPSGTKVYFVKTSVENYGSYYKHFVFMMKKLGRERILRKDVRKGDFVTDEDIQIEHEEGCVYIDDLADDFEAGDWEPFELDDKILVRKFIKP